MLIASSGQRARLSTLKVRSLPHVMVPECSAAPLADYYARFQLCLAIVCCNSIHEKWLHLFCVLHEVSVSGGKSGMKTLYTRSGMKTSFSQKQYNYYEPMYCK